MKNKGFIGPIELIMSLFALILDGLSFLFAITALDTLFIPSLLLIVGGFFLGALMFIKTGSFMKKKDPKKLEKGIQKQLSKKIFKKLGLSSLGEIIPFIGGIIPVWSISVYLHLKETK